MDPLVESLFGDDRLVHLERIPEGRRLTRADDQDEREDRYGSEPTPQGPDETAVRVHGSILARLHRARVLHGMRVFSSPRRVLSSGAMLDVGPQVRPGGAAAGRLAA